MSAKRRAAITEYRRVVEDIRRRTANRCENPFCAGHHTTIDPNHVPKRSRGAPLADPSHIVRICRYPCHDQADNWARDLVGALDIAALGAERFLFRRLEADGTWSVLEYQRRPADAR